MSNKKDIHVVHRDDHWAVVREGQQRAISRHETKVDATQSGREVARKDKVELTIHNKDSRISDSDSYGRDPHPPKDKKR